MELREYPPVGIGAGGTWTKDLSDNIPSRTTGTFVKYKTKVTSASYANGWYVAAADSIYFYSFATTYNTDEWPPSGAFDKLVADNNTKQGLRSSETIFTNATDASPGMNVYISIPHHIKLYTYNIQLRTGAFTANAPTKWNVYGSTGPGTTWTLIHGQTATGWTDGGDQTFTANSTVAYNSFRFELLRNNSAAGTWMHVGEIRLYGYPEIRMQRIINDGYPNELTTPNSMGMAPLTQTRMSSLRGVSGLPIGNIKMSDFLTQFTPSDSLYPTTPFRLRTSDGLYYRYDPANSQVNATVQHIYFTTELDTAGTYNNYKKPGYVYFLKDIGQNLYARHAGFVMFMNSGPSSIDFGYKAVPAHNAPNHYTLRSVYGGNYFIGYDSAANRFRIELQGSANIKNFIFDTDDYPPVSSGLVGLYTSESFNGNQWTDISGSGNHVTTKTGTINQNRNSVNNRDFISGNTTSDLRFPTAILPATYTLFHVAKHNGATRGRIFQGLSQNWLSGFHTDKTGVAFHGSWITQSTSDTNGTDWIVCTDQTKIFRSQKANRTTLFPTINYFARQLSINYSSLAGANVQKSDWAIACIIVYNRELSINEILQMENWLYKKYNLSYMPPVISGMVGMYTAESWGITKWTDISGNYNDVTTIGGTITVNYSALGGRNFLTGTTTSTLTWPTSILPPTYTLFHLSRYNGTKQRIFTGYDTNWLSGFYGGNTGVAFHNEWITPISDLHGNNWILSTDQNNLYRSNRIQRSNASPGTPSYAQLSVNTVNIYNEPSDWAIACVIVYNRTLNITEYNQVENWIAQRYSLTSMITDTKIAIPPDPPTQNMVLWIDALTHSSTVGTNVIDNSQNSYNFTLTNSAAYRSDGTVPHFNFEGSYGVCSRVTDIPSANSATIIAFTSILNSSTYFRTMLRTNTAVHHQVIVESGSNRLGMFNNTTYEFIDSGIDLTMLPTPYTTFNMLIWKLSTTSPYYQFSIGRDVKIYNITDVKASFTFGISMIGSYQSTQYWGKISTLLYYNKFLSSLEIADIYNQYKQIYNYPFAGDSRFIEDGQWNVLYDFTNPLRDASGNLTYIQNNSLALKNKSHNRIAYYMQNRMGNGVMYYIYVSMDSFETALDNYRIPDTVNTNGIQQRNVTNLNIYSNHPQVGNYSIANGRIEIWPYNYTAPNFFGDGNTTTFDVDDTRATTGTYGCVQVHDMINKKTLIAWNRHSAGNTPDIGIGNNDSSNIHYISAGNPDWSFAQNGAYGWEFQVLVNTDKEFVNTIRDYDNLVCAYSLQRLSNTYTGPTVNIRRSTDNVSADFYANITGDLGLELNATGQSLVNWLAGASAFVTRWYDQSGKNNHAYQKTTSAQPTINLISKFVNFAVNQFLYLPDGTVPYDNSPYTLIIKHDELGNATGGMLGSGKYGTNNSCNAIRRNTNGYTNYWWSSSADIVSGYLAGNVVTYEYDGSNVYGYINGILQSKTPLTTRTSTSVNNTLGVTNTTEWMTGGMYYCYIFNKAISDSDRLKAEASLWIQPEITGPLDIISGVAANSIMGVWSVKRVTRTYFGPTVRVRRSTDNMIRDFYSDINGNLGALLNARGQTLESWLNHGNGAENVVTQGLSLYYDVNNSDGFSVSQIYDLSENSRSGTLSGSTSSITSGYVSLVGGTDWITTSFSPNLDNNRIYTFELWFWDDATGVNGGQNTALISNYSGSSSVTANATLNINNNGTISIGETNTSASSLTATSAQSVCDGIWHHIVKVATSTQQLLYIDGILVASTTRPGGIITSGRNIVIGGGQLDVAQSCRIGPVRIYLDKALSLDEILYNKSLEYGRFYTLTLPATGYVTTWYDQSGKGRHATQTLTSLQPTINTINKYVDFSGSTNFTLPTDTIPTGNASYTFVTKHGVINNTNGGIIGNGTYGTNNQSNALRRRLTGYSNYWWANDLWFDTYAENNVVSVTYNGSIRNAYVNTTFSASLTSSTKNTIAGEVTIGRTQASEYLNGTLYYIYVFSTALTDVDRNSVEAT